MAIKRNNEMDKNPLLNDKTEEDNNRVLEPFIIISKLPEYLKGIKNPINIDYSKPSLIKNNSSELTILHTSFTNASGRTVAVGLLGLTRIIALVLSVKRGGI